MSGIFRRSLPFVPVLVLVFGVFDAVYISQIRSLLLKELREKSKTAADGVGHPLYEAFAMGEYDRIQQALDGLKAADPDIAYAVGIELGSQVIASTDPALRNRVLSRSEFEASAWQITDVAIRDNPEKPGVFEVVVPIRFRSAQMGLLRIGISQTRLDRTVRQAALVITWIALVFTLAGAWVCGWISARLAADASFPEQ